MNDVISDLGCAPCRVLYAQSQLIRSILFPYTLVNECSWPTDGIGGFIHGALVYAFDAPPRYGTFADPVAGPNEVLADVTAVGLHPVVKALAGGSHYASAGTPPFISGVDGEPRH
jgi:hypothetical protein